MGNVKGSLLIDVNDIIGKRIGRLEVLRYHSRVYDDTLGGERVRHYYVVKCDCGNIKILRRGQLVNEIVHSCGCIKRRRKRGD